jgi:DNA-directed RNA polymerase specialized sigma24 family protein
MDVPATASSLKLPQGTVKARLFRARDLLRAKLQPLAISRTPLTRAKESL